MRAQAVSARDRRERAMRMAPLRVLIVDDDADVRELIAERMREDGIEVLQASSSLEGLEQIGCGLTATPPRYFDLILSDVTMPSGGGLDLLWTLRMSDYPVPIVLLSGYVDETTRARAIKMGATAVLDKPFDLERLHDLVLRVTEQRWWWERETDA